MRRVLFPVVLSLLVLAGCSTPQTVALRNAPARAESGVVELGDVPFFPLEERRGGPAALATLLTHAGRATTPAQVVSHLDSAGHGGKPAQELAAVARRQGRLAYPVAPQLEAVLAALHQGYPVLVQQNGGVSFFPIRHYAVVVGADRAREKFWLRSGGQARQELAFAAFERAWARGEHWAMLVIDPAAIPDSLDARTVIRELALMERAGAVAEAQAGFNRAVLNWPEQKPAWLGLASTSLRLGQMDRAESVLRELVRRAPRYGAGLNNLADLLLKTGRPMEALPLAEQAVTALDIAATRRTLKAAQQALQPLTAEALPVQPGDLSPAEVRSAKETQASEGKKQKRYKSRAARSAQATKAGKAGKATGRGKAAQQTVKREMKKPAVAKSAEASPATGAAKPATP